MRVTVEQAAARVQASLGRPARDALEATVVLEAWGGLPSRTALRLSPHALSGQAGDGSGSGSGVPTGEVNNGSSREILGLVATLLATTAWVAPLITALGTDAIGRGWMVALPVSIGLQWLLRRRHLTGPDGVGRLRTDRPVVAAAALATVVVLVGLLVSPVLALPGALVVTWVGGLLIVVRGWGIPYAVSLLAATWGLRVGLPVVTQIFLVVLLTAVAVAAAMLTGPAPSGPPTPWRRSLPAGVIGGLGALLIVMDPGVEWSSTRPFPVLALVPSLLGTLWAGRHLNRIWTVLVRSLASTSLFDRMTRSNGLVFGRIILGSLGRLVLGTVLASLVVFLVLAGVGTNESSLVRLLVGLGAFGVISFLTGLLESFSQLHGALLVTVAALAAAGLALGGPWTLPGGSGLTVGAVVAILAAVVPVSRLARRPDRTLATLI